MGILLYVKEVISQARLMYGILPNGTQVAGLPLNVDGSAVKTEIENVSLTVDTTGLALATKQDTIIADLVSIDGHVDGLETLGTAANALLSTIDGHVDGLETLGTAGNASLSTLVTKQADGSQKTQLVDGAGSAEMGTAGTRADAEATPTLGGLFAYLKGYNGTTWDYLRAGITTVSATLTGMRNTLPWAVFHTTPTTRTNGQGGPVEADASGNLRTADQFMPAAEQNGIGVYAVEQQFSYTNMVTATTTTPKSSAGLLHAIIINKAVLNGVITVYDNTAGSGNKIATITFGAALLSDPPLLATYNLKFLTGLTIVTSAATDITVVWR